MKTRVQSSTADQPSRCRSTEEDDSFSADILSRGEKPELRYAGYVVPDVETGQTSEIMEYSGDRHRGDC